MRNVLLGTILGCLIAGSSAVVCANEAVSASLEDAAPKAQVIAFVRCTEATTADEAHLKEQTLVSSFEVVDQYKGEPLSNFVLRQQPTESVHFNRGERAFLFLSKDETGALHLLPGNFIYQVANDPYTGAAVIEYNGGRVAVEQFAGLILKLTRVQN